MRRQASGRYVKVDGLRGIAALLVLAGHLLYFWLPEPGAMGADVGIRASTVGVVVFFAISGFVVYLPFAAAGVTGSRVSVPRFLLRRAVRVLIPYWVVFTCLALVLALPQIDGPRDAIPHLLLLQVYSGEWILGGLGQAWSLSVELSFYLLLPLLAWASQGRPVRLQVAALVTLGAASMLARALLAGWEDRFNLLFTLPATFVWFVAGMVAALVTVRASPARAARLAPRPGVAFAVIVACALALVIVPVGTVVVETILYGVIGATALAVAAFGTAEGSRLATPQMRLLGAISYGVYLWHATIASALAQEEDVRELGPLPYVVSTVVLTLLLAYLLHVLVERPALRLVGSTAARTGRAVRPLPDRPADQDTPMARPALSRLPAE